MGIKVSGLWGAADTESFSTGIGSGRWSLPTWLSGRATHCGNSSRLMPLSGLPRGSEHWEGHPVSDFHDTHPKFDERGHILLANHRLFGVLTQCLLER